MANCSAEQTFSWHDHALRIVKRPTRFAVPIDVVLKVKDQIVAHGRMRHGYLGVTIQNPGQMLADVFGQERPHGALVAGVDVGSAAETAGLKSGDIITGFNGEVLNLAGELVAHLGLALPGDRVRLAVWRARTSTEMVVRLDEAMDLDELDAPQADPAIAGSHGLGWQLRALTNQERSLLGVTGGVWVDEVSGASAQAGLLAGDVLLAINLKHVQTVDDVHRMVRGRPLQLALLIDRDGRRLFLPMSLE